MIKRTKPQQAAYDCIDGEGGAVLASYWTTGSGRYTKRRAIPPGAAEYWRGDTMAPEAAKRLLLSHGRAKSVIALYDL